MNFQEPPPQLNHTAPKWFHEWVDAHNKWLMDNRIMPGLALEAVPAPGGGTLFNWKKPLQPNFLCPWQVYVAGADKGADPRTYARIYVKVNPDSSLHNSMKPNGLIGVTGMDDLVEIKQGYSVWIEQHIDEDRDITSASIVCGKPSTSGWDNFPDPVTFDDETSPDRVQTYWRQLLAYVGPIAQGQTRPYTLLAFSTGALGLYQVTQCDLRACDQCHDLDGAIVKANVPWYGKYVDVP